MTDNNQLLDILEDNDSQSLTIETIRCIISVNPAYISRRDEEDGRLPLHIAVRKRNISIDIIEYLISLYEGGIRVQDTRGNLPLHVACWSKASVNIISLLIKSYPESVKIVNEDDKLPLHLSLMKQAQDDVIFSLINAYPEGIQVRTSGSYPIHLACSNGASTAVIDTFLRYFLEGSKICDKSKQLPIHLCKGVEHDVIRLLVQAHPESLSMKDVHGNLPLHSSIIKKLSTESIILVISSCPDSVREKNKQGCLPLHLALRSEVAIEVVSALVHSYPQSLQILDNDRHLPIIGAIMSSQPFEVIRLLVDEHPEGVRLIGPQGKLPLHYAISKQHISSEVISLLIESYPESVRVRDSNGYLPVHLLVDYSCESLYSSLLLTYPECVRESCEGGWLPIHQALHHQAPLVIIQLLVDAFIDSLMYFSSTEVAPLPINTAFQSLVSLEVVKFLINKCPQCLTTLDSTGKYPIHHLVGSKNSLEIVQFMIHSCPESVQQVDTMGNLPLHLALQCHQPLDIIATIVQAYPESVSVGDRAGKYPIHFALSYDHCIDIIDLLVSTRPNIVRQPDGLGDIPLHVALAFHCSSHIIALLVNGFAESVRMRDSQSRLPLHLALMNRLKFDTIKLLLSFYPEIVKLKESDGSLPIHIALKHYAHFESVRLLHESYPESLLASNDNKSLPLHLAVMYDGDVNMIKYLLDNAPQATQKRDDLGCFPLHLALKYKQSSECIDLLLDVYPEAIQRLDHAKMLPLHYAIEAKQSPEVLNGLLYRYPDSVRIQTLNGMLPIQLALLHEHPRQVIEMMTLLDLPLTVDGSILSTHGYTWTLIVDPHVCPSKMAVFIVHKVCQMLRKYVKLLAYFKDKDGRAVLNIASSEVKTVMYHYLLFCGRFELETGHPLHFSPTTVIVRAKDYSITNRYSEVYDSLINKGTIEIEEFRRVLMKLNKEIANNHCDLTFIDEDYKNLIKEDNEEKQISKINFEQYCCEKFGSSRVVAIKFMKSKYQYDTETQVRANNDVDPQYVIGLLDEPAHDRFLEDIESLVIYNHPIKAYKHCVIMFAADRNLESISRSENPSIQQLFGYLHDLTLCVDHLHSERIMHGDVKATNTVRLDGKMLIIDLDASASFNGGYCGAKFRTGVLPPEMFVCLSREESAIYIDYWTVKYKEYWGVEIDPSLWSCIHPFETIKGTIVVKSFDVDRDGQPREPHFLPYQLVPASESVDVWSLGLLFYSLITGKSLLQTDKHEDLDDTLIPTAATWRPCDIEQIIMKNVQRKMQLPRAAELLIRLLRPNPSQRASIQDILQFFDDMNESSNINEYLKTSLEKFDQKLEEIHVTNQRIEEIVHKIDHRTKLIEKRTKRIANLSTMMIERIKKTEAVLLRGILEAVDVRISSFHVHKS